MPRHGVTYGVKIRVTKTHPNLLADHHIQSLSPHSKWLPNEISPKDMHSMAELPRNTWGSNSSLFHLTHHFLEGRNVDREDEGMGADHMSAIDSVHMSFIVTRRTKKGASSNSSTTSTLAEIARISTTHDG
ncbi:hypothetical protein DEO72_LG7g1874 [Vigna unguiculata]|uniref:Uncharacterized protein n=1 Tax=Vigna unguiculata TaxID=3917 RepID=A0A4D6MIH0_VIGUN|nr:hypothetical protein DEO72_LG7g1874 [Vigna unguiculata]